MNNCLDHKEDRMFFVSISSKTTKTNLVFHMIYSADDEPLALILCAGGPCHFDELIVDLVVVVVVVVVATATSNWLVMIIVDCLFLGKAIHVDSFGEGTKEGRVSVC